MARASKLAAKALVLNVLNIMFDKMEMLNYPNGVIVYKNLDTGELFKLVAVPIDGTQNYTLQLQPFTGA